MVVAEGSRDGELAGDPPPDQNAPGVRYPVYLIGVAAVVCDCEFAAPPIRHQICLRVTYIGNVEDLPVILLADERNSSGRATAEVPQLRINSDESSSECAMNVIRRFKYTLLQFVV